MTRAKVEHFTQHCQSSSKWPRFAKDNRLDTENRCISRQLFQKLLLKEANQRKRKFAPAARTGPHMLRAKN
jgi:hypothetical protein